MIYGEETGGVFIALSKRGEGGEKGRVQKRKGEVFAGLRRHEERFTEGKQSVKMTGYGSCCHWLLDVKS